jgi:hypothetical protein
MDSSNILRDTVKENNVYGQIERSTSLENPSGTEIPTVIHELLILQDGKMDRQQQYLKDLTQGLLEVLTIVSHDSQPNSSSTEAIEALKQQVVILEKGVIKIYQHLEKDNTGKELKSGQQTLRKAIDSLTPAAIKTNQKSSTSNVSYLDWKQIAIIITATAIISSLCSLAIFQTVSNWKTDQPQNPVEKSVKPKNKKNSK